MKKDLVCVHLFNDHSGSPRVLCDVVSSIKEQYDNVYVLTSQHDGFLQHCDASLCCIPYGRANSKLLQILLYLMSQIYAFLYLCGLVLSNFCRKRKTVILINTLLPFGAALAGKLLGCQVLYYVHESHIRPKLMMSFLVWIANVCASHAVFVSQYVMRAVSLPRVHCSVIYNGLRRDFMASEPLNWHEKHRTKQIVFAGSLKEYKGIQHLIHLADLLPTHQFIAALNCNAAEFDAFCLANTIPDNLILKLRPDDIQSLYEQAFLVVNLSIPELCVETFGLSLLEGMAFGCPVIAPPAGGPIEFVSSANGLLVHPADYSAICDFINRLSDDFELWKQYAESGLDTARTFSAQAFSLNIKKFIYENDLV